MNEINEILYFRSFRNLSSFNILVISLFFQYPDRLSKLLSGFMTC